ncbi:MAG: acyl carrier protein [Kiloniellales bacterium]|nr:acyl carrier protein [Kiloniellales bacterium]
MSRASLEQDIRRVIAAAIHRDPERIGLDDDFEEDLGLDSLDRLDLLAAVEDELGLRIPEEALSEIRTLADVLKVLDGRPREMAA